ncbi:hypothetical protein CLM85_31275 [Streptomyces albidoflavus]|uniref:DUF192 domain-containing protein n=1 Tax=Streptomyces albidoflavus TaxID=1886 RepID=UPI000BAE6001|nr:DUF192 domain-containing protein [Streptomyces albidoflavus]PAX88619.1 hypothetical protein CLM81_02215 [Streptomyces albidoflavus]PAX89171.1 hypothetical protein CLM82_22645 [Streptomyces albidoflavus]PBO18311.1 hypothetical protein CLM83_13065 [Streptomyces albidoflavus]PBO20931.1 hypothetical protein CLM85_31275 [Streptomyces albidoflavus]PBO27636.1 hypothetical protein CLM84_24670 [Streptomyces albidoflavus]
MATPLHPLDDGTGHLEVGGVTVPLQIAASLRARTRGLLGHNSFTGALLLSPAKSVHTLGMRIPIDIAYLDRHLRVVDLHTMKPHRIGRPRVHAHHVLEAEAGSFARWGVAVGLQLGVSSAVSGG